MVMMRNQKNTFITKITPWGGINQAHSQQHPVHGSKQMKKELL
jgi:hypothetical protein